MDILTAAILGLVEGITEFLPISSTGHLILVNQLVSFSNPSLANGVANPVMMKGFTDAFDIIIQMGAILAVIIHFRKR